MDTLHNYCRKARGPLLSYARYVGFLSVTGIEVYPEGAWRSISGCKAEISPDLLVMRGDLTLYLLPAGALGGQALPGRTTTRARVGRWAVLLDPFRLDFRVEPLRNVPGVSYYLPRIIALKGELAVPDRVFGVATKVSDELRPQIRVTYYLLNRPHR